MTSEDAGSQGLGNFPRRRQIDTRIELKSRSAPGAHRALCYLL
jgi:hypothetical protein